VCDSFASFQETIQVLTEAAIIDHHDALRGLKQTRHRHPPDPGSTRLASIAPRRKKKRGKCKSALCSLQREKANMASELQAMEGSTAAAAHQGDDT
jgi:DNA-directed RNA polymerase subunit beta'